jgi:hypothetical protein
MTVFDMIPYANGNMCVACGKLHFSEVVVASLHLQRLVRHPVRLMGRGFAKRLKYSTSPYLLWIR